MLNLLAAENLLRLYKLSENDSVVISVDGLEGYPQFSIAKTSESLFYIKEIKGSKEYIHWLETIYKSLANEDIFIHPLLNRHGSYLTSLCQEADDSGSESATRYILLNKYEAGPQPAKLPMEWWATCLYSIHNKVIPEMGQSSITSVRERSINHLIEMPNYNNLLEQMRAVQSIIEPDVKNLFDTLLIPSQDDIILERKAVPVHGDPLFSNVLLNGNKAILCDFESSGISVPEYDIQRLLMDFAMTASSKQELYAGCLKLISAYEMLGTALDEEVLDYCFRIDLLRTFFWLYKVSLQEDRQDYERQTTELKRFKSALRSGRFHVVLSAIHRTRPFDLKFTVIHDQAKILMVARLISSIVPDFSCTTLGGSRAHFLDDESSDVEMYFYSKTSIPTLSDINRVLEQAGAIHKRSESFLWNEKPWGPHSFFELNGLYFEIGYRVLPDVQKKIDRYIDGIIVDPQKDCHDLGLGYLFSGLAASVQAEIPLLSADDSFSDLQVSSNRFTSKLLDSLKKEYLDTAENLINGKLYAAAKRQDIFFYSVLATRIIRCLMVMAFAITRTHFPGDKWNEILLLRTGWKHADQFLHLLNNHLCTDASCEEKYLMLKEAFSLVKNDLKNTPANTVKI